jgi:hypothetical protein
VSLKKVTLSSSWTYSKTLGFEHCQATKASGRGASFDQGKLQTVSSPMWPTLSQVIARIYILATWFMVDNAHQSPSGVWTGATDMLLKVAS